MLIENKKDDENDIIKTTKRDSCINNKFQLDGNKYDNIDQLIEFSEIADLKKSLDNQDQKYYNEQIQSIKKYSPQL